MNILPDLTDEEFQKFSGEHLFYEIQMLFDLHKRFDTPPEDSCLYGALLESYIIHTTTLLEFFYKPALKVDDAQAIHFIKDIPFWKRDMPRYESYFRKFSRKRNRELVHLSYKRLEVTDEDRAWYGNKTIGHIKLLVELMLKYGDAKKLHPKLFELEMNFKDSL